MDTKRAREIEPTHPKGCTCLDGGCANQAASYDEFEFAIECIRAEYSDGADIEKELRYAKSLASSVVVDYDEGPCGIEFTIDGHKWWYLIGDAQWDADDPRSLMLSKSLDEIERLRALLRAAVIELDEHVLEYQHVTSAEKRERFRAAAEGK